ncbi:MAG: hypothetical protein ACD_22C00207G0006 [uncultured bacterium]|uniref:HIT domain-containing protein n=1 Tax=candidate division WWE3 bacterium TaxID=2053526 RepID=A0A656PNY2_UNCKA|nr:hypothetical protein P147_WWE3C00001G0398 [candidate division WWE3 bacterium RAAC2_WWE3_1]EKD99683.1 MAG: hypothetical protein ACD_22C00207G0006 [uncultured bacterium]KKS29742.1 MAG: putative HIT family protein [candidate division WWE3 bacterium GW2011_GWB1_42_117]KKS55552.1 MAG: putative HIT family protein [candidate division WWE3 bacterium GW2011_GWD2_42_34]KKT06037.1 MAG: putative HIT family protein [candidate division WWE3 bacterium GW2011_GWE2_43_18]KKT06955.1 MAG: putative HIT family 
MKIAKALFHIAQSPLGDLIVGIAFGRLSSILPVNRIKENEFVIAFWHPRPSWEKHILLVPKKQIRSITSTNEEDRKYIAEVYRMAKEVVLELGWDKSGYTILVNGGDRQDVHQIHFHLCSGPEVR